MLPFCVDLFLHAFQQWHQFHQQTQMQVPGTKDMHVILISGKQLEQEKQ